MLPALPAHVQETKDLAFLKNFVVSAPALGQSLQVHSGTMKNAFYVFPSKPQKGCCGGGLDGRRAISSCPRGALSQPGLPHRKSAEVFWNVSTKREPSFEIWLIRNKKARMQIAGKCSASALWNVLRLLVTPRWWLPAGGAEVLGGSAGSSPMGWSCPLRPSTETEKLICGIAEYLLCTNTLTVTAKIFCPVLSGVRERCYYCHYKK